MVRSFILAFAAKVLLEESKSVTDKFKFSDVNRLKYIWQFCCYRHTSYEFHFINNKWTYTDRIISFDLLNTFLEKRSVYLGSPPSEAINYFIYNSYIIKIKSQAKSITFIIPDVLSIRQYIEKEISYCVETANDDQTPIYKITYSNTNAMNANQIPILDAVETENYLQLKKSLTQYFAMDDILKNSVAPPCISMNGPSGTGKTTFGSYVAGTSKLFSRIYIFNLVNCSKMEFTTMMKSLDNKITEHKVKKCYKRY